MSLVNFVKTELKNLVSAPATEKYPDGPPTYKEVTRGHVVNDMDLCVLCGVCQMRCPTKAITVDKKVQTWSIRPFSCIQCRRCVDNCPKKSLSIAKEYTEPDVIKKQFDFELSEKQKAMLAEQARQAAERAALAAQRAASAASSAKAELGQGKENPAKSTVASASSSAGAELGPHKDQSTAERAASAAGSGDPTGAGSAEDKKQ